MLNCCITARNLWSLHTDLFLNQTCDPGGEQLVPELNSQQHPLPLGLCGLELALSCQHVSSHQGFRGGACAAGPLVHIFWPHPRLLGSDFQKGPCLLRICIPNPFPGAWHSGGTQPVDDN